MSQQAQSLKHLRLQVGKYYLDGYGDVRGPVYKQDVQWEIDLGYVFAVNDKEGYDNYQSDGTFDTHNPGAKYSLIQECTQDGTPLPALPDVIRLDDKSIKKSGYPGWFLVLTVHDSQDNPHTGVFQSCWDLCLLNNGLSVKASLEGNPAIGTGFTNHLDFTDYTLYGMSFSSEQEALNAREFLKDGTRYKELVQEFIGSKENRIRLCDDQVDSLPYVSPKLKEFMENAQQNQANQMKTAQSQAAKMQNRIADFEKQLAKAKEEIQYHKHWIGQESLRIEMLQAELSDLRQVQTILKKARKGLL